VAFIALGKPRVRRGLGGDMTTKDVDDRLI